MTSSQPFPALTHTPTKLAVVWFTISSLVVLWDIGYIVFRPYSFKGMNGALSWMWPGYQLYETVDNVYSMAAWTEGRGWPMAETTLNIVEDFINAGYLYLALAGSEEQRAVAPLVGLMGVLMTFSKTILYFLSDFWCGWCETSHNSWARWLGLYVLPNGFWIVFPGIITFQLAYEVADRLQYAAGVRRGQKAKRA